MSEQILRVPLKQIRKSPFQMRQAEDPAVVREIADSIAKDGLQEYPKARQVGEHYELVFGHTRLAAYQLLHKERGAEFESMPVIVTEIRDDRQMFELGLVENVKRQDLNAIEVATAMRVHMDTFKATSEETGKLFGVAAATVRGKVRLLELPKAVTDQVASGELPEVDARVLITVQKLDPSKLKATQQGYKDRWGDETLAEIASRELQDSEHVVSLGTEDRDEKRKFRAGGRHGWPLETTPEKFPRGDLPKLELDGGKKPIHHEHLENPPACSACPFHAKLDDEHLCGLKTCFERKRAAWGSALLKRASRETKWPIYEETDGSKYEINGYDGSWNPKKAANDPTVRLTVDLDEYSNYAGLPGGVVPVLAGTKKKSLLQTLANRTRGGVKSEEAERRLMARRKGPIKVFLREVVVPYFIGVLDDVPLPVLQDFAGYAKPYDLSDDGGAREYSTDRKKLQTQVAFYVLWRRLPHGALRGPGFVFKVRDHAEKQAKIWGVKLPKAFVEHIEKLNDKLNPHSKTATGKSKPKKTAKKGKKK